MFQLKRACGRLQSGRVRLDLGWRGSPCARRIPSWQPGSEHMERSIGFIGLGNMGLSMARNLLRRGFELRVYNRSPEKARELTRLGAVAADGPAGVGPADGPGVDMGSACEALQAGRTGSR